MLCILNEFRMWMCVFVRVNEFSVMRLDPYLLTRKKPNGVMKKKTPNREFQT